MVNEITDERLEEKIMAVLMKLMRDDQNLGKLVGQRIEEKQQLQHDIMEDIQRQLTQDVTPIPGPPGCTIEGRV